MSNHAPRWQTFLADLMRRRVFRVAALYGGIAFAALEALDLLASGLGLPQQLITLVTLLVLAGFPVAIVLSWVFDITPEGVRRTEPARGGELEAIATEPRRRRWPAGIAALLGLVLLFAGAWIAVGKLGWTFGLSGPAYAVDDPLGSYVVLPFTHRAETPEEAALAESAAARLTRQLRGWETVRVVPDFALTGVMFDLGLTEPTLPSIDVGLEVARRQRVGTLIALTAEVEGDSAFIEAVLYDVAGRRAVRQPVQSGALARDLDVLVAPVTQEILDLRDQPVELDALRSESPNPLAHREFEAGLDALYGWRLPEAEERFREAVAQDSAFALPHHYLALTLYWKTAGNPERIMDLGPEIARLARLAERLADERDLRPGLRQHVRAFRAFWEGDYVRARRAYGALLAGDSTDTEAWLLLGALEFADPWLADADGTASAPRSNLNLARRAFETTARLSPDFQLSYGHLFDIDRMIADAALERGCPAYERPGGPLLPPYAVREARDQEAFCPVERDSIRWVEPGEVTELDRERAALGAQRTEAYLERWASIQPDQPRPQEEWADQLLWRQSLLQCDADPALEVELSGAALGRLGRALELRGDTTPEDRVRLAVLSLAAGNPRAARELTDEALAELAGAGGNGEVGAALAPGAAANVYLATGRPGGAVRVLEPGWAVESFAAEDPDDGSLIFAGEVGVPVGLLRVLGAVGVGGAEAEEAFGELARAWTGPGYSARQTVLLRWTALSAMGLGPALSRDRAVRAAWFDGWEREGLPVPDVWRGLAAAADGDEETARLLLKRILLGQVGERTRQADHFLAGVLAEALGDDSVALTAFSLAAGCPASIGRRDSGWGLRSQSLYRAARAADRLGRDATAASMYRSVLDLWWDAEPELAAAVDTATNALTRLP